jgi:hypothetical protein
MVPMALQMRWQSRSTPVDAQASYVEVRRDGGIDSALSEDHQIMQPTANAANRRTRCIMGRSHRAARRAILQGLRAGPLSAGYAPEPSSYLRKLRSRGLHEPDLTELVMNPAWLNSAVIAGNHSARTG